MILIQRSKQNSINSNHALHMHKNGINLFCLQQSLQKTFLNLTGPITYQVYRTVFINDTLIYLLLYGHCCFHFLNYSLVENQSSLDQVFHYLLEWADVFSGSHCLQQCVQAGFLPGEQTDAVAKFVARLAGWQRMTALFALNS